MSKETYRSGWSYIGEGLGWALICLGIGGCALLMQRGDDAKPLIVIERAK